MVTYFLFHATMAQSVERLTRNEKVAGSIPAGSLHQKSPQNLVDRGLWGFLHVKNVCRF